MTSLIRKCISKWLSWRSRRELHRASPKLKVLSASLAEARRHHRPTRSLEAELRAEMNRLLRPARNHAVEG